MPVKNIFESINSQYFDLTNSERKVADYVLAHQIEAQYMSISELAEECSVADATISRFCRRLGLGGYNAFKLELAKASMAAQSAASSATEPGAGEDTVLQEGKRLLSESVAALEQTLSFLKPEQVELAVRSLEGAKRVFCMGQGSSMVMAEEAWTLFSTVSTRFIFVPDSHLQITAISLMEEGDVVLFFSYSGSTKDLQDVLELSKTRGVKVVLITRFPKSPGGQQADVVLQCGSNEGPMQAGSVNARMAQLFVISVLFDRLCSYRPEVTVEHRELISEAVARKHL